jgi:hypothetical protein
MGAWVPAMQLLNTLADTAAASGVVVKGGFRQNTCVSSEPVQERNGILYRAGLKILARSSGRGVPIVSTDVPTADIV